MITNGLGEILKQVQNDNLVVQNDSLQDSFYHKAMQNSFRDKVMLNSFQHRVMLNSFQHKTMLLNEPLYRTILQRVCLFAGSMQLIERASLRENPSL